MADPQSRDKEGTVTEDDHKRTVMPTGKGFLYYCKEIQIKAVDYKIQPNRMAYGK